ncbi:MAG TPA: adenylate cyclase [Actinomycetes bacterium]|nr:adenylate cyclase [Actinomycetes bacterium]
MAVTAKRAQRLSDADLERLLGLLRGADSAELKLTVPDSEQRSAVAALGMDPLDAQIRQVFFFDTPDLVLNKHGLVVRARRVQQRADDSVVKMRPVVPDNLPASLRKSKDLVVEVDAMPGGYVCSASLKGTPGVGAVKAAAAGDRPIRKLFSKQQRAFFTAHAPEGVALNDLSVLGPINLMKLKFSPRGYRRRLVAELWLYPDGSRILELSTKCTPTEAFDVAAETRAFLASQGVDLSGEQQTKTSTALAYFSRNLKATAGV